MPENCVVLGDSDWEKNSWPGNLGVGLWHFSVELRDDENERYLAKILTILSTPISPLSACTLGVCPTPTPTPLRWAYPVHKEEDLFVKVLPAESCTVKVVLRDRARRDVLVHFREVGSYTVSVELGPPHERKAIPLFPKQVDVRVGEFSPTYSRKNLREIHCVDEKHVGLH